MAAKVINALGNHACKLSMVIIAIAIGISMIMAQFGKSNETDQEE